MIFSLPVSSQWSLLPHPPYSSLSDMIALGYPRLFSSWGLSVFSLFNILLPIFLMNDYLFSITLAQISFLWVSLTAVGVMGSLIICVPLLSLCILLTHFTSYLALTAGVFIASPFPPPPVILLSNIYYVVGFFKAFLCIRYFNMCISMHWFI